MDKKQRAYDTSMKSPKLETPKEWLKYVFWDVVHPDSLLRSSWDVFMLLVIVGLAIVLPVRISFSVATSDSFLHMEKLAFWAIDAVFVVDIFNNFRTAIWSSDGQFLVWTRREIALHYIQSSFLLDVISTIPWSAMVSGFESGQPGRLGAAGADLTAECVLTVVACVFQGTMSP